MAQTRSISLKLFLEGIEIDCARADVQAGIGGPATASIHIPAAPSSHEFLPRTLVHLFYLDMGLHAIHEDGIAKADPNDPKNWKLLFGGEVTSYGYRNMGGNRSIVLSCLDFSSYWSSAQLYWGGSRGSSLHNKKKAVFAGATVVAKGKKRGANTIINILSRKPATNPKLPGLLGGLVSLLESATGVFGGEKQSTKNFRGVNDFMSQAEIRLKLTRMLGAAPNDDTSQAFIGSSQFRRYFRRVSRSVGSTASYMQLTSMLLGKVYHQWSSVAAPPYIEKGAKVSIKIAKPRTGALFADPVLGEFHRRICEAWRVTAQRLTDRKKAATSGDETGTEPGLLKLDYVHLIEVGLTVSDQEGDALVSAEAPTSGTSEVDIEPDSNGHRQYAAGIAASQLLEYSDADLQELSASTQERARARGATSAAQARHIGYTVKSVILANGILRQVVVADKHGYHGDEVFTQHTLKNLRSIRSLLEQACNALKKLSYGSARIETRELELDERLHAFMFNPDIYMVPPPRCNVIFPDHYSSISFSRNWLAETTRLWMFGRTKSGKDKKNVYFAPNVSMTGIKGVKRAVDAVKKGASIVLPHEKFVGIVPAFEGLGDNDIFKKLHKREVRDVRKRGGDSGDVSGRAAGSPQEHLQRAANFVFFAKRFQNRNIQIEGRFMPQLVPGWPAMVLDPDSARSSSADASIKPVHYLGVVAKLNHSITSGGGATTSVLLTKCRVHNEGMDLFGDEDGVAEDKTYRSNRQKVGEYPVPYSGRSPQGYAIIEHITAEVVAQYNPEFVPKKGAKYIFIPKDQRIQSDVKSAFVEDGQHMDGHEVVGEVDPLDNVPVSPDPVFTVEVFEVVTTTTKKEVDYNLEDTLTPPWFADIYRKDKIGGDYYYPMAGCLASTDGLDLNFAGVTSAPVDAAFIGKEQEPTDVYIETGADGEGAVKKVKVPASIGDGSAGVKDAAESLAALWVAVREANGDMDQFIEQYTLRKHASLNDMYGGHNPNLVFKDNSWRIALNLNSEDVGFHGDAFGAFTDLASVDGSPIAQAAGQMLEEGPGEAGEAKEVGSEIDPRLERGARVMAYLEELLLMGRSDG